jgi:hypothetical protein
MNPRTRSACARLMSEPTFVSSASGSPTVSSLALSAKADANASYAASWTRIRERASQDWPAE